MTSAILVVMIVLFIVMTIAGRAGRIGRELRPLIGQPVRIEIWGQPLPGSAIESITTAGAGINLKVSGHLLKIAQPNGVTLRADRTEIAYARYVSWDRKRIPQPPGSTAPAVVFFRTTPVSH